MAQDNGKTSGQRYGRTSGSQGSNSSITRQPSNEISDITFYSYSDIRRATSGLSDISRIGKWRYGNVYKGYLDKREVFIKTLDTEHDRGKDEFLKELKILKEIRHPNLVKLLGACIESRTLVYELLPDLSLEDCLDKTPQLCTWQIRTRVIYQLCSALIFLYSNHSFPIIHGYLNPSYIYLDSNFNIKVFLPGRSPSTNPRPKGRFTEYIETGNLKLSSDAYSFGVMVLTLLTGSPASGIKGEVQDEWLRRNIDSKAGSWPFPLAKKLAYFGSKFCNDTKNSSAIEIAKELGAILGAIDKFINKEPRQPSNNKEMKRLENSPRPPAELVIASTRDDGSTSRRKSEDTRVNQSFKPFSQKEIQDATSNFSQSLTIEHGGYGEVYKCQLKLVMPSTGGYGSTSRRKSEDTRVKPSFKPFSAKEIQDATNNFNKSLVIGEGGYGKVYKCQLDNWDVAVKILDDQGDQGLKEYIREMEVLETMRHENLIHLMGTCFKFRALVYEYLPNGSLEDCLKDRPWELTWEIRTRIVYEICTALRFLHANKPEPLVHGDLKPHNVLLDANFKVKLADFGLCRYLTQGENSKAFRQTMHVSGSPGYMDPDFLETLKITPGVDVYSLGKTVVRILTGKHPPDVFREVYEAKRRGSFMDIVDPAVKHWPENVVEILTRFALRSTKPDRSRSEFMGNFHSELEKILDGIDS
ncbi:putative U-box domain-containing protein 33 isoform X5 [Iris pallida]|uniref:RING-type E3 ubiquitin transferase n=1 Tax=Iris pallida TaxID=29817 RepID=A0AAX6EX10_IRIPA|nr:putative U-box domain-containing protein 33 isoform X5 [Iris pallida]